METAKKIERYRRQYFQLIDPLQLTRPPLDILILPEVQEEMYTKMFSSGISFLPSDRYRFRVLKSLIDVLPEAFQDPEEDVRLSLHSSPGSSLSNPSIWQIPRGIAQLL